MGLKGLAKKAKKLLKGEKPKARRNAGLGEAPPVALKPPVTSGTAPIPMHGWKGAKPGDKGGKPVIGGHRATGPKEGGPVLGGHRAGTPGWKPGEKGGTPGTGLLGTHRGGAPSGETVQKPEETKGTGGLPLGYMDLNAPFEASASELISESASEEAPRQQVVGGPPVGKYGLAMSEPSSLFSKTESSGGATPGVAEEQKPLAGGQHYTGILPAWDSNGYQGLLSSSRGLISTSSTDESAGLLGENEKDIPQSQGSAVAGAIPKASVSTRYSDESTPESESDKMPQDLRGFESFTPDVQTNAKAHSDVEIAKMQSSLRFGGKHFNKDVDEKIGNSRLKVERERLSKNEENSKGWALLGIRDSYRNKAGYSERQRGLDSNGKLLGGTTKYFVSQGYNLHRKARFVLGPNLEEGEGTSREDTVIRFQGGKWVDAGGKDVDTSEVEPLNQEINEFIGKTREKMSDAEGQGLTEKLEKAKKKLEMLRAGRGKELGLGGRYIYVMNASGELFAGKSQVGVIHHSSFLAGGAVAGAGEIQITGGQLQAISNTSGHYRPGPAYLWQVVKQLEMQGVPLESVRVDVMGVPGAFKNAKEFLGAMDPIGDPSMFDAQAAIDRLKKYLADKKKSQLVEKEAERRGGLQKGEGSKGGNGYLGYTT